MPGGIKNEQQRPKIGQVVQIGHEKFSVTHVHEIMPPREEFLYLHATIEPLN